MLDTHIHVSTVCLILAVCNDKIVSGRFFGLISVDSKQKTRAQSPGQRQPHLSPGVKSMFFHLNAL